MWPYSPDHKTMGRFWKLSRRVHTHNRYSETPQRMIDAVTPIFETWKSPEEALRNHAQVDIASSVVLQISALGI